MTPSIEYLAGFFDGEGSVGVYTSGTPSWFLKVQVNQTDTALSRLLLGHFRERWGGSITEVRTKRQPALQYQVGGKKAAAALVELLPHLVLKAPQAALAIEYEQCRPKVQRGSRGRIVSMDLSYGEGVSRRLKAMKRTLGVLTP